MPLKWDRVLIADERYESCGVFDVDGDGVLDIVSGAYWYRGPEYTQRHPIGEIMAVGEYFDDFSTLPMDINGNGRLDFVTGGWWGDTLRWRENPGTGEQWPEHIIAHCGNVETTRMWDIDGDGHPEVIPNTPGGPVVAYKLIRDAQGRGTGAFQAYTLWDQPQGHGLGYGDLNGNGRGDIILAKGWLEAPEDRWAGQWRYHADWEFPAASVPILAVDITGDGRNELIVGGGHRYGLEWYQLRLRDDGGLDAICHPIDPYNSQYHDLIWADLDGDGACELVTGKRYRAHCGNDPGAYDDVGIYYFKWNGESFSKQVITYGPPRVSTGCGIAFALADLTGNGLLDLVAPGKDGLYLFKNRGL
jgi:hypothetical protein